MRQLKRFLRFHLLRCKSSLLPGTDYAQKRNVIQGFPHPQFNQSDPIGINIGNFLDSSCLSKTGIARKAGGPIEALSLASINPLVSGTNPERKYMSAYCGTSILRN